MKKTFRFIDAIINSRTFHDYLLIFNGLLEEESSITRKCAIDLKEKYSQRIMREITQCGLEKREAETILDRFMLVPLSTAKIREA